MKQFHELKIPFQGLSAYLNEEIGTLVARCKQLPEEQK